MATKCIPKLPASDQFNFVKEEEKILEYWSKNRVFEIQSIRAQDKVYSFYDGPPFATGLPHYGHILAGTVKDVVTRYAFQTGHSVERRFGWDCHGLPIEFEMDKLLNIKSPQDVHKMGIDKYNAECRNIVMRYTNEWRTIVERLGRWIDFDNDYKTMNTTFMESVWWIFKQLYMKGFVYQGFKVMPYSAACTTPLSNFEATQNYKDVVDPSLFVLFELKERPQVFMLSWTTTPWTLPSNLALCVNADFDYVEIVEKATNRTFIMAENRLSFAFAQFSESDYEIVNKYRGCQLQFVEYKPLFEYFSKGGSRLFRILCDNYVTADAGTGVVHQAPYFGEQDYRVCIENGVIAKDQEPVCPLDEKCCFTSEVSDWQGIHIKDADPKIIAALKARKLIFKSSQIKHSYPFCWRSDTPLVYRAVNSWFIRASQMIEELLKANESTYWVPDFVKEKRFGNWLRDAHDWAVSRNRFWGTPIPIWMSDDGEEIVCVGSRKELCDLVGEQLDLSDLHREFIDKIEIPSKRPNKGTLKRVPEVFDCWFESGSMPFAQNHYPFENKQHFENTFPADFISEGIDQTRGWFYTLLVISTAIYHKAPFKNLIASGLVLASDGQKMSKRKKNYPNPMDVINSHGSDALRLYLISSPVVRAENLRFNQNGVRAIVNDVFRPWYNSFRFLFQNIEIFVHDFNENYSFDDSSISAKNIQSFNVMDRWILSFMQSLIRYVDSEMKSYRLYNVLPKLISFVDKLTNWYIRLNRQRSKGLFGKEDCIQSLLTLNKVLNDLSKLMSPITPFITEYMHRNLTVLNSRWGQQLVAETAPSKVNSVHLERIPVARADLIDAVIERSVLRMQTIVELGRVIRDAKQISMKFPLNKIIVIHKDDEYLNDVESLKQFLLVELNCREIVLSHDYRQYKVKVKAEPNYNTLGEKLKSDLKTVKQNMLKLSSEEVEASIERGYFEVGRHRIDKSDSRVTFYMDDDAKRSNPGLESNSDSDVLILLDMQMTRSMIDEGMSREITNRVQKLRKKAGLVPLDQVRVYYHTRSVELLSVVEQFRDFIETQIKSPFVLVEDNIDLERLSPKIIEEKFDMKNGLLQMTSDRFLTLVLVRVEEPSST